VAPGEVFHGTIFHVVLGAGDPPHAAGIEIGKVVEVDVGLVEYVGLALRDVRAELICFSSKVILTGISRRLI
jgi:hypothetical protein